MCAESTSLLRCLCWVPSRACHCFDLHNSLAPPVLVKPRASRSGSHRDQQCERVVGFDLTRSEISATAGITFQLPRGRDVGPHSKLSCRAGLCLLVAVARLAGQVLLAAVLLAQVCGVVLLFFSEGADPRTFFFSPGISFDVLGLWFLTSEATTRSCTSSNHRLQVSTGCEHRDAFVDCARDETSDERLSHRLQLMAFCCNRRRV